MYVELVVATHDLFERLAAPDPACEVCELSCQRLTPPVKCVNCWQRLTRPVKCVN